MADTANIVPLINSAGGNLNTPISPTAPTGMNTTTPQVTSQTIPNQSNPAQNTQTSSQQPAQTPSPTGLYIQGFPVSQDFVNQNNSTIAQMTAAGAPEDEIQQAIKANADSYLSTVKTKGAAGASAPGAQNPVGQWSAENILSGMSNAFIDPLLAAGGVGLKAISAGAYGIGKIGSAVGSQTLANWGYNTAIDAGTKADILSTAGIPVYDQYGRLMTTFRPMGVPQGQSQMSPGEHLLASTANIAANVAQIGLTFMGQGEGAVEGGAGKVVATAAEDVGEQAAKTGAQQATSNMSPNALKIIGNLAGKTLGGAVKFGGINAIITGLQALGMGQNPADPQQLQQIGSEMLNSGFQGMLAGLVVHGTLAGAGAATDLALTSPAYNALSRNITTYLNKAVAISPDIATGATSDDIAQSQLRAIGSDYDASANKFTNDFVQSRLLNVPDETETVAKSMEAEKVNQYQQKSNFYNQFYKDGSLDMTKAERLPQATGNLQNYVDSLQKGNELGGNTSDPDNPSSGGDPRISKQIVQIQDVISKAQSVVGDDNASLTKLKGFADYLRATQIPGNNDATNLIHSMYGAVMKDMELQGKTQLNPEQYQNLVAANKTVDNISNNIESGYRSAIANASNADQAVQNLSSLKTPPTDPQIQQVVGELQQNPSQFARFQANLHDALLKQAVATGDTMQIKSFLANGGDKLLTPQQVADLQFTNEFIGKNFNSIMANIQGKGTMTATTPEGENVTTQASPEEVASLQNLKQQSAGVQLSAKLLSRATSAGGAQSFIDSVGALNLDDMTTLKGLIESQPNGADTWKNIGRSVMAQALADNDPPVTVNKDGTIDPTNLLKAIKSIGGGNPKVISMLAGTTEDETASMLDEVNKLKPVSFGKAGGFQRIMGVWGLLMGNSFAFYHLGAGFGIPLLEGAIHNADIVNYAVDNNLIQSTDAPAMMRPLTDPSLFYKQTLAPFARKFAPALTTYMNTKQQPPATQ